MLSKIYANTFKQLTFLGAQPFSVRRAFFDFIYRDDTSDSNTIATSWCPKSPLQGYEAKKKPEVARNWETTKLSNGITVLTESTGFPGKVDFGFLLNVGTRDECTETSGSLLSIKNTYLKTIMNTNETINYGIV
jgi:processing peptidase subunit beta